MKRSAAPLPRARRQVPSFRKIRPRPNAIALAFVRDALTQSRRARIQRSDRKQEPAREAYVSTERYCPQETARLSRPHGNRGRPTRHRQPAEKRAQALNRLTGCCARHLRVLKQRADYLRVAGTRRRFVTPGIVVQFYRRPAETLDAGEIRYGITASRRVGKAVVRNRVRRRLRAAAEQVLPVCAERGCDYVLVGRQATASRPFDALIDDLKTALQRLRLFRHAPARSGGEAAEGDQRK
jgi:ribonuclease P protein component